MDKVTVSLLFKFAKQLHIIFKFIEIKTLILINISLFKEVVLSLYKFIEQLLIHCHYIDMVHHFLLAFEGYCLLPSFANQHL